MIVLDRLAGRGAAGWPESSAAVCMTAIGLMGAWEESMDDIVDRADLRRVLLR